MFFERRDAGKKLAPLLAKYKGQKEPAKACLARYCKGKPPLVFKGKTTILVDDGLATGATMKAAIQSKNGKV